MSERPPGPSLRWNSASSPRGIRSAFHSGLDMANRMQIVGADCSGESVFGSNLPELVLSFSRHRSGLDQRQPLPGLGSQLVIQPIRLEASHQRPLPPFRSKVGVDPIGKPVDGGLTDHGRELVAVRRLWAEASPGVPTYMRSRSDE